MASLRALPLLLLVLGCQLGCQYDLDKLYQHAKPDAGQPQPDAGELHSKQLIGLWRSHPAVDGECVACAEQACATVDASCRTDPDCVAYTECVAVAHDPAAQTLCRQRFASWVRASNVRERDLAGPYGQCVFRDHCATQCDGYADLSCLGKYAWSTTREPSVPLHLFLTNAVDAVTPLAQVAVKACEVTDFSCEQPTASGITDERGYLMLPLKTSSFSRSFTGFLEVRGEGLYPTLLKFGWEIATETTQIVNVVHEQLFKQAIGSVGVVPDPTRGMLQLRMLGCAGIGMNGISFMADRADARSRSWYLQGGIPKLEATETDFIGSGGIIDVPELPIGQGHTSVLAHRAGDPSATVARADAPIRAGFMSVVVLTPLTRQ